MNLVFIIAQIFGLIALFFSLRSFFQSKKEKYVEKAIFANIFNVIHYLLLNAYSALIVKIIAIIRELSVYKKEKNKKNKLTIFFSVVILYILTGILTFNNDFRNILPIISALSYFIAEWFGSIKTIKIVAIITTIIWLIFDISVLSISGIIHNSIITICLIYSFKKKKL